LNNFDTVKLNQIRADLEIALRAVGQKHGLDFNLGRITYGESDFTAKLMGVSIGALPQEVDTRFAKEYAALSANYPSLLGRVFYASEVGEDYTFIGYSSRSPKYPFIVRMTKSGKILKLSQSLAAKSKRVEINSTVPSALAIGVQTQP
jgi:hypothetical protein